MRGCAQATVGMRQAVRGWSGRTRTDVRAEERAVSTQTSDTLIEAWTDVQERLSDARDRLADVWVARPDLRERVEAAVRQIDATLAIDAPVQGRHEHEGLRRLSRAEVDEKWSGWCATFRPTPRLDEAPVEHLDLAWARPLVQPMRAKLGLPSAPDFQLRLVPPAAGPQQHFVPSAVSPAAASSPAPLSRRRMGSIW